MLTFVIMGNVLEQYFGSKRFLNFYLITGIGAGALYSLFNYMEFQQYISQLPAETLNSLTYENGTAKFIANGANSDKIQSVINGSFAYLYAPSLGASGAVYGILTAFAILFPNVEMMLMFIPFPVKAKFLIPFMLLLEIILNFAQFKGDQIAHLAHLTGAFMGFLLIKLWRYKRNTFF
jgi:rhomboid-like protein